MIFNLLPVRMCWLLLYINIQGALPTPQLSVNLACLPACHPTTPEQSMQASQALCAPPVISVFAHNLIPRHSSYLYVYSLACFLILRLSYVCIALGQLATYANFGVTRGN